MMDRGDCPSREVPDSSNSETSECILATDEDRRRSGGLLRSSRALSTSLTPKTIVWRLRRRKIDVNHLISVAVL